MMYRLKLGVLLALLTVTTAVLADPPTTGGTVEISRLVPGGVDANGAQNNPKTPKAIFVEVKVVPSAGWKVANATIELGNYVTFMNPDGTTTPNVFVMERKETLVPQANGTFKSPDSRQFAAMVAGQSYKVRLTATFLQDLPPGSGADPDQTGASVVSASVVAP